MLEFFAQMMKHPWPPWPRHLAKIQRVSIVGLFSKKQPLLDAVKTTLSPAFGDVSCLPKNGNAEAELPGGLKYYFETLKFQNKLGSQNPVWKYNVDPLRRTSANETWSSWLSFVTGWTMMAVVLYPWKRCWTLAADWLGVSQNPYTPFGVLKHGGPL